MLVSVNWLKEFVPDLTETKVLIEKLPLCGFEIDSIKLEKCNFSNVVVGLVLNVNKNKNLFKCNVQTANDSTITVVTSANIIVGCKVPVAVKGTILCGVDFKPKNFNDISSEGMFCSYKDLGINSSVDEIIILPTDSEIGQKIEEVIQFEDTILDIDITPNRGDVLSVIGMAREVAAICNSSLVKNKVKKVVSNLDDIIELNVMAPNECSHFCIRTIKGVDNEIQTPFWIKNRLRKSDIKSVNFIVDITNYVMIEMGQPMHAYDMDNIAFPIEVRLADSKEKIELINDEKLELSNDMLVIADAKSPISIAGIMGGKKCLVSPKTKNIILESAFFNPDLIMGKARKNGLQTDSSFRFERGVDPQLQLDAIERASELIISIAGGNASQITEYVNLDDMPQTKLISFKKSKCAELLGVNIEKDKIEEIFSRLGFTVLKKNSCNIIRVPTHRFDINEEVDLIEEIIRIYGYGNLPRTDSIVALTKPEYKLSYSKQFSELLVSRDYHEVITYSFVSKLQETMFKEKSIKLLNPLSEDNSIMRQSLWPGLIEALLFNLNHQKSRVRLFEIGMVFGCSSEGAVSQQENIAGLLVGQFFDENWKMNNRNVNFFDLKKDVELLLEMICPLKEFIFESSNCRVLHPGKSADIKYKENIIGTFGQLHPRIQKELDITETVYVFEIAIGAFSTKHINKFIDFSRFPSVKRDLSFFVNISVKFSSIIDVIDKISCKFLQKVSIFDVYVGDNVPQDQKSLGLSFSLQHADRTLVDKEVESWLDEVVGALYKNFNITIRDQNSANYNKK